MEAITFKLAELELAGLTNFSLSSPLENNKPVLLFIHGWQDNAATFSSLWQFGTFSHPNAHFYSISRLNGAREQNSNCNRDLLTYVL